MQRDPQNHDPQDHETRTDDLRRTRLNRVPINDSQRDSGPKEVPPKEATTPPPAGGYGDSGDRFGATDDRRYDYGSPGGSMGGSMSMPGMVSAQDERTWSMLAHLSILVSLVTGIGGFVAALAIWLIYKDRSPRIGFHALQSFWYQMAWAGLFIAFGVVATILSVVTLGLAAVILFPLGILLAFVPFVHQVYAAIQVNKGVDYRYPIIADMIDGNRHFG